MFTSYLKSKSLCHNIKTKLEKITWQSNCTWIGHNIFVYWKTKWFYKLVMWSQYLITSEEVAPTQHTLQVHVYFSSYFQSMIDNKLTANTYTPCN